MNAANRVRSFFRQMCFTPTMSSLKAASPALAAALLFGASTPLAKLLVGEVPPLMLASLLYLGSGLGLAMFGRWDWVCGYMFVNAMNIHTYMNH
jgi:hypothetical protein